MNAWYDVPVKWLGTSAATGCPRCSRQAAPKARFCPRCGLGLPARRGSIVPAVGVAAIFIALLVHLRVQLNDRPAPLPPAVIFAAPEPVDAQSQAVANVRAAQLTSADPDSIFPSLRGFRPGPPAAMAQIERLQQQHLESFHRAHPPRPPLGPPDPQEILNRLHSFYPVASTPGSPATQPNSAGEVTYTPTHFEYHIEYDSAPDQQ